MRSFAAALSLILAAFSVRAQAPTVDVALVLAVDVSLSMNPTEQRAQREGYVAALRHPLLADAVARGERGRIALAYMEWGGPSARRLVLPWTVVATAADLDVAAARIAAAPYWTSRGTSITHALDAARTLLGGAPVAARRVIDVSGDGPNNMGGLVTAARDRAIAAGIEINGLPLMLGAPDLVFSVRDLDVYFADCVIGGPRAFVIPVLDSSRFASAIRQKLILEIASAAPPPRVMLAAAGTDCTIGERLYQRWLRGMRWR